MSTTAAAKFYELTPNKIGRLVSGIDLKRPVPDSCREQIIRDVREHRLLVFRGQGRVGHERQLEISRWFGRIESTFFDHPKSPHRDIFRVSNDRSEGCTQVGRTGWHIDGSFQEAPFSHSIYHIIECPQEGATVFAPLTEIIESMDDEKRSYLERLHMVSDGRRGASHPVLYSHPETGKRTMCFHLGMTEGFVIDRETPDERLLTEAECDSVLSAILDEFVHRGDGSYRDLVYPHEWRPGDFIISDNLALGHEASPETQLPPSRVGLRVMHRVTVAGKTPPKK